MVLRCIDYIGLSYGSEMYRLYRTKFFAPVMANLYRENDVII